MRKTTQLLRKTHQLLLGVAVSSHLLANPVSAQSSGATSPALTPKSQLEKKQQLLDDTHPKLKFRKEDFVPIPDMVEIPVDIPEHPAKPVELSPPDIQHVKRTQPTTAPPVYAIQKTPQKIMRKRPTQQHVIVQKTPSTAPPRTMAQQTARPPPQVATKTTPKIIASQSQGRTTQTGRPDLRSVRVRVQAPVRAPVPAREGLYTRARTHEGGDGKPLPNTKQAVPYKNVAVKELADLTPAQKSHELAPPKTIQAYNSITPTDTNTQAPDEPLIYRSPGIIVRKNQPKILAGIRESDITSTLGALSPAAGAAATDEPLITLPTTPLPPDPYAEGLPPLPEEKIQRPHIADIAPTADKKPAQVVNAPLDPDAVPATVAQAPLDPDAVPTTNVAAPLDPDAVPATIAKAPLDPDAVPTTNVAAPLDPDAKPATVAKLPLDPDTATIASVKAAIDPDAAPLAAAKTASPTTVANIASQTPTPPVQNTAKPQPQTASKSVPEMASDTLQLAQETPDKAPVRTLNPAPKKIAETTTDTPAQKKTSPPTIQAQVPVEEPAVTPKQADVKIAKEQPKKTPKKQVASTQSPPAPSVIEPVIKTAKKALPVSPLAQLANSKTGENIPPPHTAKTHRGRTAHAPAPIALPGGTRTAQAAMQQHATRQPLDPNMTPLMSKPALAPVDYSNVTTTRRVVMPQAPFTQGTPPPHQEMAQVNTSVGTIASPQTAANDVQPLMQHTHQQPQEAYAAHTHAPHTHEAQPEPQEPVAQQPEQQPMLHASHTLPIPPPQEQENQQHLAQQHISPASQDIIDNLPPLGASKKSRAASEQLAILRGKSALQESNGNAQTINHESMGVKIEVRTPRINMDYELEKAYNALIAGNADAAAKIYRLVLENDTTNKNALFGLATIYHRTGQLDMARPLYAKLLTIDPDNRDGLNNFLVLLADEAPEDALMHLEQLKALNPEFSPIPAQMAVIYQKIGRFDKATENMTYAIKAAPENMAYRYNFAIMLDKQGKHDQAAKLYQQIMQAHHRGVKIPGDIKQIQQRLTFIMSNR